MLDQNTYNFEIYNIKALPKDLQCVCFKKVTNITAISLSGISLYKVEDKQMSSIYRAWTFDKDGFEKLKVFIKAITGKDLITNYYLSVV